jgi:hypothetical protein
MMTGDQFKSLDHLISRGTYFPSSRATRRDGLESGAGLLEAAGRHLSRRFGRHVARSRSPRPDNAAPSEVMAAGSEEVTRRCPAECPKPQAAALRARHQCASQTVG